MSLYNMIFGKNPSEKEILALLGLTELDVERFRECWIDERTRRIVIMTRTGGGNREYYRNEKLTSNPYYIDDHDDDFDSTYAYYEFAIPNMNNKEE